MGGDDPRVTSDVLARGRLAVDALGVRGLAGARWSGLAGAGVDRVAVREVFPLGRSGGVVIVEAGRADGTTSLLTLPLEEPATWEGLHRLVQAGGSVAGSHGGRLDGRPGRTNELAASGPGRGAPARHLRIRAVSGDQSHSSVIVNEASVLKLYRRLTPGLNPEAEILRALAPDESAPVPSWHGSVDLVLSDGEATSVAIEQAFVVDTTDAFEILADGLAMWLRGSAGPVSTAMPREIGIATGRLHTALARVEGPAFAGRRATPEDRASWLATAGATLGGAIAAVATTDPDLARWLERHTAMIEVALRALADPARPLTLQRIHGDLHLGQVLPTPNGVLLIDFEGDPTRDAADRRSVATPLRDVAAMLRSLDHVARSGLRRAGGRWDGASGSPDATAASGAADTLGATAALGAAALDGWIQAARTALVDGYAAGLGDPAWAPDATLLRALEVEKELAEFIYAATYLPAWLYAPVGGLGALVGSGQPPQGLT